MADSVTGKNVLFGITQNEDAAWCGDNSYPPLALLKLTGDNANDIPIDYNHYIIKQSELQALLKSFIRCFYRAADTKSCRNVKTPCKPF